MRRPTNQARFYDIIEMIHSLAAQTAISTDVITGFPGESDEAFEESYAFIQKCNFNSGHVFSFSPMPGTEAINLPNQVHQARIKERTRKLLTHFSQQELKFKTNLLGKKSKVLFESKKQIGDKTYFHGFSEEYQTVVCQSAENLINQIRTVELIALDEKANLVGEIT
jgi:threonylcarbamoyladenosine tRNA methylthiotransferase MtaB